MELSTSIDCAREILGIASTAIAVPPVFANLFNKSGLCPGFNRQIRQASLRSKSASCFPVSKYSSSSPSSISSTPSSGGRILRITSACSQIFSEDSVISAPESLY